MRVEDGGIRGSEFPTTLLLVGRGEGGCVNCYLPHAYKVPSSVRNMVPSEPHRTLCTDTDSSLN